MDKTDDSGEAFGVDPAMVAGAVLIDVRRAAAFEQAAHMLPTAVWRDPARVAQWATDLDPRQDLVVYCVHGHEVSRGADTDRLDLAPQCAGLLAISLGLSRNFPDHHEMLRHGLVLYDALYAWCCHARGETHSWNYG